MKMDIYIRSLAETPQRNYGGRNNEPLLDWHDEVNNKMDVFLSFK
jgi:hypothetical protein